MSRRVQAVMAFVGLALLTASRAPGSVVPEFLADDAANKNWHTPDNADEAVALVIDAQHPAIIIFKKDRLRAGPVKLKLESDAMTCTLRAAGEGASVTVDLGSPGELSIDASPAHPSLRAGEKDLPALRGKWTRICLDDSGPTITLELTGATYATLKFEFPGANVPAPGGGDKPVVKGPDNAPVPAPDPEPAPEPGPATSRGGSRGSSAACAGVRAESHRVSV